jgi:cytochrome c oxidase subunit 4
MAEAVVHGHDQAPAAHAAPTSATAPTDAHQEHPIKLYLVVWGWLFILSAGSYLVDYFHLQGYLRWSLILVFMMLKAGLIVAVFMHMAWERLALAYAIIVPPVLVLVFVAIMAFESDYTLWTRLTFFGNGP